MDVGCYCVHLSRALTGAEPVGVRAEAHIHEFGVDDYAVGTMRFPGDVLATFTCGMTVYGDWTTFVCGTEGWIEVIGPWFGGHNSFVVVEGQNESRRVVEVSESRPLYAVEADRFADSVLRKEPAWIGRADTVSNMRVLDELRRSAGMGV